MMETPQEDDYNQRKRKPLEEEEEETQNADQQKRFKVGYLLNTSPPFILCLFFLVALRPGFVYTTEPSRAASWPIAS